jgi:hypothetical protein
MQFFASKCKFCCASDLAMLMETLKKIKLNSMKYLLNTKSWNIKSLHVCFRWCLFLWSLLAWSRLTIFAWNMWAFLSTISDGKSPLFLQVQSLVQLYKAKYITKISSVCNLRHLFQELNNCLQRSADLLYPGAEDLSAGYCVLWGHCGRLLPGCGSGGCQRYGPLKRYFVPYAYLWTTGYGMYRAPSFVDP